MFSGPLEDRIAIRELNDTYSNGVVRKNAEIWATVWDEDAHWSLMGTAVDGRDAIVAFWKQAMAGLDAVSFHCIPTSIEIEGDRATASCQTQEIMAIKDGSTRIVGGLYEDELVKRDGKWLFSSRIFNIVAEYKPKEG